MPKSLLHYVIAEVEPLSDPVQESCACSDATSLVLVLLAVTVIAREKSGLLRLTSCSFSSLLVQQCCSHPSEVEPLPALLSSSFLGQRRRLSIFQDGSLNALYLRGHFYLLLRLAGSLGSLTFPWKHFILAHHFSCLGLNLTYGIGVLEMSKANVPACPRGRCFHHHELWMAMRGHVFDSISAFEAAAPRFLGYSSLALEAYSWPLNGPIVRKIKSADCKTLVNKISLSSLLTNPVSFHSILHFNPLLAEHDMF